MFYLPLYYEVVKSYSPVLAGAALLPQCALSGGVSAIAGIVIAKTGAIKGISLVGWLAFVYGLAQMNVLDKNTTVLGWILLNIPASIGNGAAIVSLTIATQASAEHRTEYGVEERLKIKAMAAGLNPFFRALGQTIGIVVGQATVANELHKRLGSQANQLLGTVPLLRIRPVDTVVNAVVQSLRVLWWTLFAFAVFNFVMTLLTKQLGFVSSRKEAVDEEMKTENEINDETPPTT
jgi:hypothetical protein